MSASSALLAEAKHVCDSILAGMRSERGKIASIKPQIETNARIRLNELNTQSTRIIAELEIMGSSHKKGIFIIALKNLNQMSEDIQQDMEKRIEECDRLYASAESLKKNLLTNALQNESTLKSNLVKMVKSYNFLMHSVDDFIKRYNHFNQTYDKTWADFSVNRANSVKKTLNQKKSNQSNQSNELGLPIMLSPLNKLRKLHKSRKSPSYVTSLESVNEENWVNEKENNAESSGGRRRYKKRTLRKKRGLRKRTLRSLRSRRNRA